MNIQIDPFMMIVSAFGMGIISALMAHRGGKNPYLWFALGFIFGILGVFAIFFALSPKKAVKAPPPAPVFKIHGPTDKFWYYLDPSHQQQGPMSRDALTTAWREGKVDLSTYVWHEELPDWRPLKETLKLEA